MRLMTKSTRSRRAGVLGAAVAVLALAAGCVSSVPNQPATSASLAARGYVEHLYYLDGVATAYAPAPGSTWNNDGKWAAVKTTNARYKTRLDVRRPTDPAKFNGTVLVEWLNVSSGADIDPTYGAAVDLLLRDGYAFVGVSAQKVGVDAAKASDPARWGSLVHPGDDYSYDMFTQAGRAIASPLGVDLLGGLQPRRLIAAGESQSAFRFVTYINAVNPLEHAFDAYFLYSRGSTAAAIASGVAMPSRPLIRTDQPEPIIDLQTEGDIDVLRSHLVRQPDTSTFRLWEVAGGAHADEHTLSRSYPPAPTAPNTTCLYRFNSATTFAVVSAAVRSLDRWVRDGVVPRQAPRITLGPDENADDPVVRDQFGNALGGIRLPELEAPTATIVGLANPALPTSPPLFQAFCRLFGRTVEFSDAQIAQLWPTHEAYVNAFSAAADKLVQLGFFLRTDANAIKAHAAASSIGS
jgi:hypothetical protein